MSDWQVRVGTNGGWKLHSPTYGEHPQFTKSEFEIQEWPPCPECGTTLYLRPVNARGGGGRYDTWILGRVTCPRGCTPPRKS